MVDAFYLMNYVDDQFKVNAQLTEEHERIANEFLKDIKKFDDKTFNKLLVSATFIPDFYEPDSSRETLFSKLVEAMVTEWAIRMGYEATMQKEKASYEDVRIAIKDKLIVVDAKTFRLGRSQAAPNVKDFLKLEDIRKWCSRYRNAIGGLVTYPCLHEWKNKSDAYTYCSTKDMPTVMLSYKHLAFLLDNKENFNTEKLIELWDYDNIFPEKLPKNLKGGNKKPYWDAINKKLTEITNVGDKEYVKCLNRYDKIINQAVKEIINFLETIIINKKEEVAREIRKLSDKQIREAYEEYKISQETEEYQRILENVKAFRL